MKVKVFKSKKELEEHDHEMYRKMSPEERLSIVEKLRIQHWERLGGYPEEFQRVVRVVKKK